MRARYMRGVPEADRFRAKVNRNGPTPAHRPDLGPCWLWTAALNDSGYGIFRLATGRNIRAHRWAYEQERGPIPDGLEPDHLCRTPACVNPAHLEPVTHAVNNSRAIPGRRSWRRERARCGNDHDYAVTLYWRTDDRGRLIRRCRECDRDTRARYNKRRRKG